VKLSRFHRGLVNAFVLSLLLWALLFSVVYLCHLLGAF